MGEQAPKWCKRLANSQVAARACEGGVKQQGEGSLLDLGLATLDLILSRMDFWSYMDEAHSDNITSFPRENLWGN